MSTADTSVVPRGRVYLIGGGPGDPGLLTLRAVECLRAAAVVVYDQLVSPRALDYANPDARLIAVRDLPGSHPDRWPHIHRSMVEAALAGHTVVRLKGGDPMIFGRVGEEADELRKHGIAYEIVPGVTSAMACGSYLEIPLTHRMHASAVALITGHENPTKGHSRIDWDAIARFPGTLCVYMGVARLALIAQELIRHGKDPDTPAAVVYKVTTGHQVTVTGTLRDIDDARKNAGIDTPALILIGDVIGLKPAASWFEARPLLNRRVLVTRPRHQADAAVRRLELLGAVPYALPGLEIRPPAEWGPVDAAIAEVSAGAWDWLVFTSANGVTHFLDRLLATGRDVRSLARCRIAAVGPATAAALRQYHISADLVPEGEYRAEALADALAPHVAGGRVLLARADRGREVLPERLRGVAAEVGTVATYRQADAVPAECEMLDHLRRGEIDIVTLTSANTARAVLRAFDQTTRDRVGRGEIRLVTISPVTSAAVREMGLPVAAEAAVYTADGVIDAVLRLAQVAEGAEAEVGDDAGAEQAGDVHQDKR